MPSDNLRLDHFKVYKQYLQTGLRRRRVKLKGQFDRSAVTGRICHMPYFANPVRKNRGRLVSKNAHLAFYELHGPKEPRRLVVLRNQFGLQCLQIGQAGFLLVPSQKVERGSAFPKRLDHYKAYQVLDGRGIDRDVLLADQIDRQDRVEVTRPEWFCVPVAKAYANKTTRPANPRAHLTFYTVTPRIHEAPKTSRDQFGDHKLLLATSVLLGVPTLKIDWDLA